MQTIGYTARTSGEMKTAFEDDAEIQINLTQGLQRQKQNGNVDQNIPLA